MARGNRRRTIRCNSATEWLHMLVACPRPQCGAGGREARASAQRGLPVTPFWVDDNEVVRAVAIEVRNQGPPPLPNCPWAEPDVVTRSRCGNERLTRACSDLPFADRWRPDDDVVSPIPVEVSSPSYPIGALRPAR